jgi:hypothetical protein
MSTRHTCAANNDFVTLSREELQASGKDTTTAMTSTNILKNAAISIERVYLLPCEHYKFER